MNKKTIAILTVGGLASLPATHALEVTGGSLSLDYNSHFISYGFDVWGTGGTTFDTPLFNPSISLDMAIDENSGLYVGAWADINGEGANSQWSTEELDLWIGYFRSFGDFTLDTNIQAWMYASQTEAIWDISLSYSTGESIGYELAPTVLLHTRFIDGAAPNEGFVLDLGITAFETALSDVSLSVPANIGFTLTDDYHFEGGDTGMAYFKTGVAASYPLGESWDVHGAVTYYHTPDNQTGNDDENFVTLNLGVGTSF